VVTGETDKVLDQLQPLLRAPSHISSGWASDEGLVLMEPEGLAGAQLEKREVVPPTSPAPSLRNSGRMSSARGAA
jgi:hypothetical protein